MSTETNQDKTLLFGLSLTAGAMLCYFFTSYRIGENEQTLGAIALLTILVGRPWATLSPWPWMAVLGSMLVTMAARPIDVPNHHFMMTYFSAAIVVCLSARASQRSELLQINARWLLVVLMGFATVHKVVSPTFQDGSYIGYEIARGGFGGPLLPVLGPIAEKAKENDRRIKEFRSRPPSEVTQVELEPLTPGPRYVAYGFALSIVLVELLLFLGFIFMPSSVLSHLLLVAFIATLMVLRQEFTFISVVAAMGFISCANEKPRFRAVYAILSILSAAAVLKTLN